MGHVTGFRVDAWYVAVQQNRKKISFWRFRMTTFLAMQNGVECLDGESWIANQNLLSMMKMLTDYCWRPKITIIWEIQNDGDSN